PATTTESHAHPNATAVLMGRLRSIAPCRVLYLACVGYCRSCVPGGNRSAVDRLDRGLWKPVTPPSTPHRERCHRDDHGAECERQCVATTPRLPAAWRRWRERQRAIGPVVDRIGEFLIPITNQNRIGSRRSTKVHDSCRTHPSCCMSGGDRAPRASTAQFDAAGNQLNTPVGSADDHAHAESDADRGSSCVLIMTMTSEARRSPVSQRRDSRGLINAMHETARLGRSVDPAEGATCDCLLRSHSLWSSR